MPNPDQTDDNRARPARSARGFASLPETGGAAAVSCYIFLDYPGRIGQTGRCRQGPRADLAAAPRAPAAVPEQTPASRTEL
ncbi:MAG: hypothetical protein AB7S99_04395 [Pseudodonghicola sp.]